MNLLFAWGNYVSLGLPEAEGSYEPQVGFCAWNTARHCAEHLLGEVLAFTDEDLIRGKTDLDKGRALLEEFLSSMPSLKTGYVYPDSNLLQASTTVAMDVDPSRIGIPDEAGMVDPLHVLPPAFKLSIVICLVCRALWMNGEFCQLPVIECLKREKTPWLKDC